MYSPTPVDGSTFASAVIAHNSSFANLLIHKLGLLELNLSLKDSFIYRTKSPRYTQRVESEKLSQHIVIILIEVKQVWAGTQQSIISNRIRWLSSGICTMNTPKLHLGKYIVNIIQYVTGRRCFKVMTSLRLIVARA